jgi:MATE family multidrug resistance protein
MAMGVEDLVMVGRLGGDATAAAFLGGTWHIGLFILLIGLASGLDPVFAQAFGAGDRVRATRSLARALALLGVAGVPVALAHGLAEPALALLGQPPAVVPVAARYAEVVGLGVLPGAVFLVFRQYLQGEGRMLPAAAVALAANGLNIAANAWFIHGGLGLPPLGVVGAAWATNVSRLAMALALVVIAWPGVRATWPDARGLFAARPMWRLFTVAAPVSAQTAAEIWAFGAAAAMVGWLGPTAVAAHAVALNLASLSFMVPLGVGAAAATRVGNLVGAGAPWTRAGWTAVVVGAGVMTVPAFLFAVFPTALAGLYSPDPAVVALAATLLPVAAAFQLFDGTQVVAFGVLRGAGDTRVPALVPIAGYWAVALPAAFVLGFPFGLGATGVWLGLTLGLASVAVALVARIRVTAATGGYRVA